MMHGRLSKRSLRLLHLESALNARQKKLASLYEVDVASTIAHEYKLLLAAFMDDATVGALISELADPANFVITEEGTIAFTSGVLESFDKIAVERLGVELAVKVRPKVAEFIAKEYRAAEFSTAAGMGLHPEHTLVDAASMKQLEQDAMYWIKTNTGRNVVPDVPEIVKDAASKGLGRKETAALLKQRLGERFAVEAARWSIVSSAALVRARSYATIHQMTTYEITEYEWLAMGDERMCPVCGEFNTNVWSTEEVVGTTIEVVESAGSPEEVIDAHPWYSVDKDGNWSKSTSKGKESVNPSTIDPPLPPAHGNCRCNVVTTLSERVETNERRVESERLSEAEGPRYPSTDDSRADSKKALADVGSKYSAMDLENLCVPGEFTADSYSVRYQWSSDDAGVSLITSWVDNASNKVALQWAIRAESGSLGVVLGAKRAIPGPVERQVATKALELAGSKGVPVAMTVPVTSRATPVAMKQWSLAEESQADFGAWLKERGITQALKEAGIAVSVKDPLLEWMKFNVNGYNPVLDWMGEGVEAQLVYLPE